MINVLSQCIVLVGKPSLSSGNYKYFYIFSKVSFGRAYHNHPEGALVNSSPKIRSIFDRTEVSRIANIQVMSFQLIVHKAHRFVRHHNPVFHCEMRTSSYTIREEACKRNDGIFTVCQVHCCNSVANLHGETCLAAVCGPLIGDLAEVA